MAFDTPLQLYSACACGTCIAHVKVVPSTRFICHCTICQTFTGKAYADMVIVRAKHVGLMNVDLISFKKYRPPPNINRGLCLKCKKPVVELGGFGSFQWAFIPASNFEAQGMLPMPQMHLFYERRVADAFVDLPQHQGYFASQLAIVRMLGNTL